MPLTPGYGETPLPYDELTALLPEVVDLLDKPITRAAVYDLEQGLQDRVFDELMPSALDTIAYRWDHTDDWTPRQLGIVVHAETVRIHPFADGNGRTTRFLADLVFAAAQDPTELQYDWELDDKTRYIELLRAYDGHRDVADLTAFVGVEPIEP